MSKYTTKQAAQKASMVVGQLGAKILKATTGTGFDPAFLAGKIGVEAGVRGGKILESATRFEPGVFADLKSLRDKGYCFVGGVKRKTYSGVRREQMILASYIGSFRQPDLAHLQKRHSHLAHLSDLPI